MDRLQLIKKLIALRFARVREAEGASQSLIENELETQVNQRCASLPEALCTPEGSIAAIVEAYLSLVGSAVKGAFDIEHPPQDEAFQAASR